MPSTIFSPSSVNQPETKRKAGFLNVSFPIKPICLAFSNVVSVPVSKNTDLKYSGFISNNMMTMLPSSISPSINSPEVVAPKTTISFLTDTSLITFQSFVIERNTIAKVGLKSLEIILLISLIISLMEYAFIVFAFICVSQ